MLITRSRFDSFPFFVHQTRTRVSIGSRIVSKERKIGDVYKYNIVTILYKHIYIYYKCSRGLANPPSPPPPRKKITQVSSVIRYHRLTNHLTPVTRVERLTFTRIPVGGAWAIPNKLLAYAFQHNEKINAHHLYLDFENIPGVLFPSKNLYKNDKKILGKFPCSAMTYETYKCNSS